MITLSQVRERLIQSIKESHIRQVDLAEQLNISQSNIAHYLNGDIMPALDTLANICKILDLDANYILCQDIEDNKINQDNTNK